MSDRSCPKCGGETTCEEVDIGVGIQQGPARCDCCGWSQDKEVDALIGEREELDGTCTEDKSYC